MIRADSLFLHIEPAGVAGASNFFWLGNFVLRFNKKRSYVYNSLGLIVIISPGQAVPENCSLKVFFMKLVRGNGTISLLEDLQTIRAFCI